MHRLTSYRVAVEDPLDLGGWIIYPTRAENPTTIRLTDSQYVALAAGDLRGFDPTVVAQLINLRVLVPEDEDELAAIIRENSDATRNSRRLDVTFMPSAACPHGCNQSEFGAYCGQQHSMTFWSKGQADAFLGRIGELLKTRSFDLLDLTFFGAEPLTKFSLVLYTLSRASEIARVHDVSFASDIVTSGLLFTPTRAEQLHRAGLSGFEVTLDGLPHHHDHRRCTKDGKPTFQKIYSNLLGIAQDQTLNGLTGTIRMNVDSRNQQSALPLFDRLWEDGLLPRFNFYVAPIRDIGTAHAGSAYTVREDVSSIDRNLLKRAAGLGLRSEILPNRKRVLCPAVDDNAMIVDPLGATHRCTETPLVDSVALPQEYGRSESWRHSWEKNVVDGRVPCATCVLFPVCGGACPKEWALGGRPCPVFKDDIESRVVMASQLHQHREILL